MSNHYDVIVAGAGIGGLCAALRAREKGVSVAIIEKAETIGGSAAASGGTIWCAKNIDEWLKVQPNGDISTRHRAHRPLLHRHRMAPKTGRIPASTRRQSVQISTHHLPIHARRTHRNGNPQQTISTHGRHHPHKHQPDRPHRRQRQTHHRRQNHTLKNNSPIRHPINRRISGQSQIARTVFRHRIRSHDRPRRPPKHRRRISKRTRSRRATYRTPQPLLRPPPPGTPRTSRPAQLPRRQTRLQRIRHLDQPQRRAIRRRISRRRSHLSHPRPATPGHRHPHL